MTRRERHAVEQQRRPRHPQVKPQTHWEFDAPLAYATEDALRAESEDVPLGGCDLERCQRMRG